MSSCDCRSSASAIDGVAVAEADDGDARHEVEVLLAVHVPDLRAFAADEDDGQALAGLEEVLLFDFNPVCRSSFAQRTMFRAVALPSMRRGARALLGRRR